MNEEIKSTVINVLIDIQSSNDLEVPRMGDDVCPLRDLPGFDSLNAVETTVMLSEIFDYEFDQNLILTPPGEKLLTISDISNRIVEILEKG